MYKSPLHTINGPSFFLPDHICYCVPQNPIVRDNNRQEEEEKSIEKRKILHTQRQSTSSQKDTKVSQLFSTLCYLSVHLSTTTNKNFRGLFPPFLFFIFIFCC